jgi:glucose-1-phosphate thymidylyltransferase
MKVILPVAGAGTRLRPMTLHLPKCLLPVAESTILGHILDGIRNMPVSEYLFVAGYLSQAVEKYLASDYAHLPSRVVLQNNPQGLGEAIHLCAEFLDDKEPVLIILCDTLFEADLDAVAASGKNILCTRKVEDPRRFGVAVTESGSRRIQKLVEKPQDFVSDQALVGIYYIEDTGALKRALGTLLANDQRTKGEYQLTDALQMMIESGVPFETAPITEWLDCGKPETLLETNRYLLRQGAKKGHAMGRRDFPNAKIIEPCFIAEGVEIVHATVGPNATVGKGCKLAHCTVQDSVLAKNCEVSYSSLTASILGEAAVVRQFGCSLLLGDASVVN